MLNVFRGSRQHYGRLNEYDTAPYIDNEIQNEDDEEDVPGKSLNDVTIYTYL